MNDCDWNGDKLFSTMNGRTIKSISGLEKGSDNVRFTMDNGSEFVMHHEQNCCESVSIEDITGDMTDLLDSPLTMAEVVTNENEGEKPSEYAESWTWTFYKLATNKGFVTIRWLGESNGYYSESVKFEAA